MENAIHIILQIALLVIALCMGASLIRTIIGPTVTDRLIGVNMINTQVMIAMVILSLRLDEVYLIDIATIYALLGFLSVVVISKIYIGVFLQRAANKKAKTKETAEEEEVSAV